MSKKTSAGPIKPLISKLKKANLVLFVIFLGCGLVAYIMILDGILERATGGASKSHNSSSISIDQSSSDRLNQLKASETNTSQPLPSGRVNPFSE